MNRDVCGVCWGAYDEKGMCECEEPALAVIKTERTLTDEVIADLWHANGGFHHHFARAIEKYLKGDHA